MKNITRFEMLQSYNIKRAIFQGYIESLKYMDDSNSARYYYSVSKMDLVNWSKHWINKLVSIAKNIPEDILLHETDTLPEDPFRLPSDVLSEVYENVAKTRKISVNELEKLLSKNTQRLVVNDFSIKHLIN